MTRVEQILQRDQVAMHACQPWMFIAVKGQKATLWVDEDIHTDGTTVELEHLPKLPHIHGVDPDSWLWT